MRWIQFLAVGRAFGSIRDRPSPYRMTQANLLPRFNAPAEPAGAEGRRSKTGKGPGPSANPEAKPEPQPDKMTQTPLNISRMSGAAGPATAAQPYPQGRWTLKNPFHWQPRPGQAPVPVQTELALDSIRPVRNDLSDADLVVVSAGQREAAVEAEAETGPLWQRLRARLLQRV